MNKLYQCGAALLLIAFSQLSSAVTVISYQDFESPNLPNSNGWGFGAQDGGTVSISTDTTKNHSGSKGSIRGTYPVPTGGLYVWGGFDLAAHNLNEVYISFWAKMPAAKHGVKFVKVFGQRAGTNYSNTTFGLDYTGIDYGSMYSVSFGDGTSEGNDTANVINFDGTYVNWIGRSFGKAVISTPQKRIWSSSNWGDSWHHFRIHLKYNSGTSAATEVADGAYYVEIDGKVYVDAKNLLNRHYTNKPIEKISLFDWSQTGKSAFEVWYDDIRITTGGFYDNNPVPPIQPSLLVK